MVRVRLLEGDITEAEVDAIVCGTEAAEIPGAGARRVIRARADSVDSVRAALRDVVAQANEDGLKSLALPPLGAGSAGLSLQACAETLLGELRELDDSGSLQEIQVVLSGEPTYRVFEMVQDAERIRLQLEKLKRGKA